MFVSWNLYLGILFRYTRNMSDVRVSAAFVTYKGRILLFHRDNKLGLHDADCWSLIGGHVEEGESFEQGLERELCEEIGVLPTYYNFFADFKGSEDEMVKLYHVPLTDSQAEQIKLGDEGQEVRFFTFEEMEDLPLTTNLREIYGKYTNSIKDLIERN